MKVSALIPTYNRRSHVLRALRSIVQQTVPVSEVLVVDDGSTDGTADAIGSEYGDRVRVVVQSHAGVSAARLKAIQEAKGEWVAFLDSDDEWTIDRNDVFSQAVEVCPRRVAWVFGDTRVIRDGERWQTLFDTYGLKLEHTPFVFADSLTVQHPFQFGMLQSSVVRRDVLLAAGAFRSGLSHSEDFLAGVQVACKHHFAAVDDVVTNLYRTAELEGSSLEAAGNNGPDYHRSRILAFSLIADLRRQAKWYELHAQSVRALCKIYADRGVPYRRLLLEQFRYRIGVKSIAFAFVAALGPYGVGTWESVAQSIRRLRPVETADNHHAWTR